MTKKCLAIALLPFCLVLSYTGCSLSGTQAGETVTLPNGIVLGQDDLDQVRSLSSEADAILAGSASTASTDAEKIDALKTLLVARIGSRASSYFGETTEVLSSSEQVGSGALAAGILRSTGYIGSTSVQIIYTISATYTWGPWWCYHTAKSSLVYAFANGPCVAIDGFTISMVDEVTNGSMSYSSSTGKLTGIQNNVTALLASVMCKCGNPSMVGNTKYGFFPSMHTLKAQYTWTGSNIPSGSYKTGLITFTH